MVRKIALALGAVVIIGLVIALLTGNIVTFLDSIWNWIFEDQLKMDNPPPSPFAYGYIDDNVYISMDVNEKFILDIA